MVGTNAVAKEPESDGKHGAGVGEPHAHAQPAAVKMAIRGAPHGSHAQGKPHWGTQENPIVISPDASEDESKHGYDEGGRGPHSTEGGKDDGHKVQAQNKHHKGTPAGDKGERDGESQRGPKNAHGSGKDHGNEQQYQVGSRDDRHESQAHVKRNSERHVRSASDAIARESHHHENSVS